MIATTPFDKKFVNARSPGNRFAAVVIAFCALFAGCASTAPGGASHDTTLLSTIHEEESGITTVRATGSADVTDHGSTYTGTIDLSLHAPDSLRVKVNGPFGIPVGILFATRTGYVSYNAIENTVMKGTLAPGAPLPFPGFTFSFDDAMHFLRGIPAAGEESSRTIVSPSCVESHDANGRSFRCELDPAGGKKAVIRDKSGAQAFEYFRDFRTIDGVQFPYHIAAQLPDRGSVKIDFDDVAVNTGTLDFSIPVPASARHVGGP